MLLKNLQIDCYVHILPPYFLNLTETSRQLFLCSVGLLQVADLSLDVMLHAQFETRT